MDVKNEFAFASTRKWVKKSFPNLSDVEIEAKSKEILEKYIADNLSRYSNEQNCGEIEFNNSLDKESLNFYLDSLD